VNAKDESFIQSNNQTPVKEVPQQVSKPLPVSNFEKEIAQSSNSSTELRVPQTTVSTPQLQQALPPYFS
jgi:hypothetical protein